MKPFHFRNFSIKQDPKVFRVGTDAVLLGALARVTGLNTILEVGTGTGIISLMLAQRNPTAEILAIDIDENAVDLAGINFKASPYFSRLCVEVADMKKFKTKTLYDLIVCNPPYFDENYSTKDVVARQKVSLNFEDLISNAVQLLHKNGSLALIIPVADFETFYRIAVSYQLFLKRKIDIFGLECGDLKRVVLEFTKEKSERKISQFIIEKSPRKYSDEYLQLTKEFHLFKK